MSILGFFKSLFQDRDVSDRVEESEIEIDEDVVFVNGNNFSAKDFENGLMNNYCLSDCNKYFYSVSYIINEKGDTEPVIISWGNISNGISRKAEIYPIRDIEGEYIVHCEYNKYSINKKPIEICEKAREIIIRVFEEKDILFPHVSPPVKEMAALIKADHEVVELEIGSIEHNRKKPPVVRILDWSAKVWYACLEEYDSGVSLHEHELRFLSPIVNNFIEKRMKSLRDEYRKNVSDCLGVDFMDLEKIIAEDLAHGRPILGGKIESEVLTESDKIKDYKSNGMYVDKEIATSRDLKLTINGDNLLLVNKSYILTSSDMTKNAIKSEISEKKRKDMAEKLSKLLQEKE